MAAELRGNESEGKMKDSVLAWSRAARRAARLAMADVAAVFVLGVVLVLLWFFGSVA